MSPRIAESIEPVTGESTADSASTVRAMVVVSAEPVVVTPGWLVFVRDVGATVAIGNLAGDTAR